MACKVAMALPLAGALVLAALMFTLLDRFDNKYHIQVMLPL